MLEDRRCEIFCMMHWEKRCSSVWLLEIESVRELMQSMMVLRHIVKNSLAKKAEPMGWPRSWKPWVSLTGSGCIVLSVGWGVME